MRERKGVLCVYACSEKERQINEKVMDGRVVDEAAVAQAAVASRKLEEMVFCVCAGKGERRGE